MLFNSLKRHHPEMMLHLALADDPRGAIDLSKEPFDNVITIFDLDIPDRAGWAFCHSIVELCTAIKPFVLRQLLEREDCDAVLYLDPDIVTFSRLDDIATALDDHNIVLTPHQTVPESSLVAVMDNEICSLKHGVYNLGFIGVQATPEGKRFAGWWAERVYHFCRADIPNGLFTDQRWIDLVPAFFDGVAILKSPRHNVATWNLTTRQMTGNAPDGLVIDGVPLGFYHFTGFDSGAHKQMARKNAYGNKAVETLIDWYTASTANLAKDKLASIPWAFATFSNGEPITREQRLVYRERPDLQEAFPDPFSCAESKNYRAWWYSEGVREYPDIFHAASMGASSSSIKFPLSAGFQGHGQSAHWSEVKRRLLFYASSPKEGFTLAARIIEITNDEGLRGLLRRIKRLP